MAKTYNNFADIITFSRGSNATVRDSDGYIKWAGHNILDDSQDFSNWTTTATTVTSNDAIAPDGTQTADKLLTGNTAQVITKDYSSNVSITWQYKHSIYLKYIDHQWIRLQAHNSNGNAWFDIQNGVTGSTGSLVDSVDIEDVGNGWYKCTVEVTIDGVSTNQFKLALADADNSLTESNGASVHVWGAHVYNCQYLDMVQNPANTWTGGGSYYKTGTSGGYFAPRIEHDPDGNVKGLLIEEERENLYGYYNFGVWETSGVNDYANNSDTLTPSGKNDSYKIVETITNAVHRFRNITLVEDPSGTHDTAHSIYVKAIPNTEKRFISFTSTGQNVNGYAVFDLENLTVTEQGSANSAAYIENAGNGWRRITIITNGNSNNCTGSLVALSATGTPSTWIPSYEGNNESGIYVWGYQVESIHNSASENYNTNLATSYIPTKSGTAYTRSKDKATLNRSNLGWNNDEGTIFVEALTPQAPNAQDFTMAFHIGDGSTTSRLWMGIYSPSNRVEANFKTTDVSVVSLTNTYTEASLSFEGDTFKQAFSYKEGDYAMSVNGVTAETSTQSGTLAELSEWDVITIGGYRSSHLYPWNAPIVNIKYYPRRLTDDQLEDLTS